MSDANRERYYWLVEELRKVIIALHGGELFSKKPDMDLIAKLNDAAKALLRARK